MIISTHNKVKSLRDFWREIVDAKKNDAWYKISGWTNVRGKDVVVLEKDGEKTENIEMSDTDEDNVLSQQVRSLYEVSNLVHLRFFQDSFRVVVCAENSQIKRLKCDKKDRIYLSEF
ncbi:MAG: hypothetical protein WCQ00_03975 [bacterium]